MIYLTWVFEFMAYSGAWKLEMVFSLFQPDENQQLQQHCFLPGGKIISGHMEGSHICSTHSPLVSHKAQCWWHLTHPCLSSFKHTCFCTALISACLADILLGGSSSAETNSHQVWVAVYFLGDASKTASPHQPLVISLDISQITPSDTACNLRVVLESWATNLLSWLKLLKWLSCRFPLHHQEDLTISIYRGHSGAFSFPWYFQIGVHLSPGRPASACHPAPAAYPESSCMMLSISPSLSHPNPVVVFPSLASCSCPHQI